MRGRERCGLIRMVRWGVHGVQGRVSRLKYASASATHWSDWDGCCDAIAVVQLWYLSVQCVMRVMCMFVCALAQVRACMRVGGFWQVLRLGKQEQIPGV